VPGSLSGAFAPQHVNQITRMDVLTGAIFSLSVGLGALTGLLRFRKINPEFLPFIYLMWAGFLNEAGSVAVIYSGHSNFLNNNIFFLGEALLICWQFYRWQLFSTRRFYYFIQVFFVVIWVVEVVFHAPKTVLSYFIISHSFIIVLMSIHMINKIVFRETTPFMRDPVFLICLGFIVYFTYSVLVETFWIFGLTHSKHFRLRVYALLSYINLVVNLVFVIAILWIPMRQRYILRS
jgi:hypothetical protein